jgi:hypothetical protein
VIPDAPRLVELAARRVRRWLDTAIGDHGWNTEGEAHTEEALMLVFPFLHALRSAAGVDPVSGANAEWLLPVGTMRTVFSSTGRPYSPGLGVGNGRARLERLIPRGFGLLPEAFRPGGLWHWNRLPRPEQSIFALVNYPDGMTERNPGEVLGNVLVDRRMGAVVARNGWRNNQDVLTCLLLRSNPLPDCHYRPDAGTFRIYGLGFELVVQGPAPELGAREAENVVLPGDVALNPLGGGRLVYLRSWTNGSVVVGARLDDMYRRRGDTGVRHLRCVGVDYGGACGAPAVFALVDRIRGAGAADWLMHGAAGFGVTGTAFSMTANKYKGVKLTGRFVTPSRVETDKRLLRARGEGDFFVVFTVQDGDGPEITVEGGGLGAVVTLRPRAGGSRRRVRFDGEKLVFSE